MSRVCMDRTYLRNGVRHSGSRRGRNCRACRGRCGGHCWKFGVGLARSIEGLEEEWRIVDVQLRHIKIHIIRFSHRMVRNKDVSDFYSITHGWDFQSADWLMVIWSTTMPVDASTHFH